jgi:hypothetical protein
MPSKRPYAPVRYLPPTPSWAQKEDKVRVGHEKRDRKFIEAIMDESKKEGKPMSWTQARKELQRQQRVSQRELLWQEHRTTLTDKTDGATKRNRDGDVPEITHGKGSENRIPGKEP